MTRRLTLLCIALLLAALPLGLSHAQGGPTTYTTPDGAFSITYPATYTIFETDGALVLSSLPNDTARGQVVAGELELFVITPALIQSEWGLDTSTSSQTVIDKAIEVFGFGSGVTFGESFITYYGNNAALVYPIADAVSNGAIYGLEMGFGNTAIVIAYAPPADFAGFEATLSAILSSVRLGSGIPTAALVQINGATMASLSRQLTRSTTGAATALTWDPSYYILNYGEAGGTLNSLGVSTGELLLTLNTDGPATAAAVSADSNWIAGAGADGIVQVYDSSLGSVPHTLDHVGPIVGLYFSPNLQYLMLGDAGGAAVWLYDLTAQTEEIIGMNFNGLQAMVVSDANVQAALGTADGVVLWDLDSGDDFTVEFGAVVQVAFSPDGKTLGAITAAGQIYLLDPSDGSEIAKLDPTDTQFYTAVTFSPDSSLVVIGMQDGSFMLIDLVNDNPAKVVVGDGLPVNAVSFTNDQRLLAVAHGDTTSADAGEVRIYGVIP